MADAAGDERHPMASHGSSPAALAGSSAQDGWRMVEQVDGGGEIISVAISRRSLTYQRGVQAP
jgi:hypothetical protein